MDHDQCALEIDVVPGEAGGFTEAQSESEAGGDPCAEAMMGCGGDEAAGFTGGVGTPAVRPNRVAGPPAGFDERRLGSPPPWILPPPHGPVTRAALG